MKKQTHIHLLYNLYLITIVLATVYWSFDRKTYTWSSPKSSRSWNPADFTMKSGGFHEIREIQQISPWNPADFMKSGRFQVKLDVSEIRCRCFSKNSSDFTRFGVDFTWNPPDFIRISWNPADFMWNRKTFARNCNSMFYLLDYTFHSKDF